MPVNTVDYRLPEVRFSQDMRGFWARIRHPSWSLYFDQVTERIFRAGGMIVDISGGLRIDPKKSNRVDEARRRKYQEWTTAPGVTFLTTDYTDQYAPDRVEDIHALTFEDGSIDGLFCIAVLEHVYDPKKAGEELMRVLKKGGQGLVYVPFLYRYHAHSNDYRDYFRYSKDGIAYLFRDCASVEVCPVRGIFETLLRFLPVHRFAPLNLLMRMLDTGIPVLRRLGQRQTSGYFIHITR